MKTVSAGKNSLAEIKKMEIADLVGQVESVRLELRGLILDKNCAKLTDLKSVGKRRKDLARMLTTLGQKQLLDKLEVKNG